MDYEKKYKEALERAKKLQETCDSTTVVGWCEYIFPELRESEDELTWLTKYIEEEAYSLSMDIRDNEDRIKLKNLQRSLAWLEKQGEQKPADNFKQKFKVGDWVTNGLCAWRIDSIDEDMYYTNHCGIDCGGDIKSIDEEYHIWTIQDAKDGDVLAEDTCTFIIKKLNHDLTAEIYCCLYDDGDFELNSNLGFDDTCTYPATKEQRDLLFQKMKEAGYEWDAEKKELKKFDFSKPIKYNSNPPSIVKEPAWTEDDENILNDMKDTIKECLNGDTRDILLDWFETIKQRIKGE